MDVQILVILFCALKIVSTSSFENKLGKNECSTQTYKSSQGM